MGAGKRLRDEAEAFYRDNPALLAAHEAAARAMARRGMRVSARFLTEFARWSTKYMGAMPELFAIYQGVPVTPDGRGIKVPNATSAWLTRHLRASGFDVRSARSEMDGGGDVA